MVAVSFSFFPTLNNNTYSSSNNNKAMGAERTMEIV